MSFRARLTGSCTTHPWAPPAVVAGAGLAPSHETGTAATEAVLAAGNISSTFHTFAWRRGRVGNPITFGALFDGSRNEDLVSDSLSASGESKAGQTEGGHHA